MNKFTCNMCEFCEFESTDNGYICTNTESEYLADWIEENHWCEEFSQKGANYGNNTKVF